MFKQTWSAEYKGHKISVNNNWFGPSELHVDDKLQDKATGIFFVRLVGKIKDKEITKELRVSLSSTFLSVECDIFVDDEAIYSSKK